MIDQLYSVVSESFLNGDYRKTVVSLDDILAFVKANEIGPERIERVTSPLSTILQNAERIHNEHVRRTDTGKDTVHPPYTRRAQGRGGCRRTRRPGR